LCFRYHGSKASSSNLVPQEMEFGSPPGATSSFLRRPQGADSKLAIGARTQLVPGQFHHTPRDWQRAGLVATLKTN
jgi:hypothetical protein